MRKQLEWTHILSSRKFKVQGPHGGNLSSLFCRASNAADASELDLIQPSTGAGIGGAGAGTVVGAENTPGTTTSSYHGSATSFQRQS